MSELEVPENDDAVFTEDEYEDENDEGVVLQRFISNILKVIGQERIMLGMTVMKKMKTEKKNLKKMATMITKMRRKSSMKMTLMIKVENWQCTKQFVTI